METDFDLMASSHVIRLQIFQDLFQTTKSVFESKSNRQLNIAELAVLLSRGGRRLPHWLRSELHFKPSQVRPLHQITEQQIYSYYLSLLQKIRANRIVPNTRSNLFATYLTGQVCANSKSLSAFAGISISSAHRWLQRAVECDILDTFKSDHEVYYLQPDLLQLVIVGKVNRESIFHYELLDDLSRLRRRSHNWLQTSKLATKLPTDFHAY